MKKWIAILLIAVLTLSLFAACSKKDKLVGTWKTESVTADGQKLSKDEFADYGCDLTVKLKKDGTGTFTQTFWGEPREVALTYDDDTVTVWGETIPYTLKGKTITVHYTYWGTELVITLKKVK